MTTVTKPGVLALAVLLLLALAVPTLAAETGTGDHGHGGPQTVAEWMTYYFKVSGWALLIFVVVLTILWKKLFPPIIDALDKRAATIRESLEAAQKAKEEAQAMIAEHESNLEKARVEGRAIVEEAKADANKVKDGIVQDARREAEDIVERGKRELELAKQSAVDDLYRQASALSFELAEKVIEKSLQPTDHQGLIDSCIKQYKDDV
jgi:F-type H+-transporting ATPase subunit b